MSDAWCDQCDRYYDPSKEHDCRVMAPEEAQANRLPHAWRPAWKRAAEAGGSLRGDGAEGTITIKAEAGAVHVDRPHIATLPTGERVELPAGTVLREGTLPPVATPQENFAALKRMYPNLAGTYERAAAKHEIAPWDVTEEQLWEECPALRPVDPDEPKPLGEQLHDEHERALRELTERVGLPREMAPSVLRVDGAPVAEITSIRFERTDRAENVPPGMLEDGAILAVVGLEGAPSATPIIDAWRAAGEPAVMTFTAEEAARLTGIEATFPGDHAKART